ncbi:MAG: hypothetical protein ACT4PT_10495 [Methanobacteriota archaeon]
MTNPVLPFAAGIVGAGFAAVVLRGARRPETFAWGAGLACFSVASFVEAAVASQGWTVPLYRLYFPLTAVLVGLLGTGTLYLSRDRRWGHAMLAVVLVGGLVAGVGQFFVPLEDAVLAEEGVDAGLGAVHGPPRWAAAVVNVVGGLALIFGAVLSWWRRRVPGLLFIAVGALLPFAGGSLSSLGISDERIVLQALGIFVMFLGFFALRKSP